MELKPKLVEFTKQFLEEDAAAWVEKKTAWFCYIQYIIINDL